MPARKKKVTRKSATKKPAPARARARSAKKVTAKKAAPAKKAVIKKSAKKATKKPVAKKGFRKQTTAVGSVTLPSPQNAYHGHDLFFAFLAGMIMTLVMQGVFTDAGANVASVFTPPQVCSANEDCRSATAVCEMGQCEELFKPSGRCLHSAILTYTERGGRTKHTFCENGCTNTPRGPRCL